ncbi:hypothetical protein SOVF_007370 isoform A [Spinacia oleracea]|uniref:Arf-GAP domain-containing protein n=1 Tax=Spinacia oleracea TaxID=3562 RepID=A0A9R0J785_SPIOL|nr:uncharacterized protein LOC110801654 [Spinacia oleracea]KNA25353.1 hypothetical protein SOVF_007370 isoform A [Spinacia oleracea]
MGKSKEEGKIEKIIRGLLKLPENRRCINCNSLGPQYVCTNFWTYVCTNCCGVHREFTHRVKSVSMAKFSMEEVSALQAGGNEKARQIYFKTWNPHRDVFPENSNIHKIRDFIKHVYVDRKFTVETQPALVQRSPNSGLHEPFEHNGAHNGENSTFHGKTINSYSRYSYDEGRSPQYSKENSTYGRHRAISPHSEGENSRYRGSREDASHFEYTDGRYQVDDTRISGRAATQMFTTEDIRPRRRCPDRQQSSDVKNPTVYHVKEILGENSHALRVANRPKFADRRRDKATANAQQERDHHKDRNRSGDHDETAHQRTVSAYAQENAVSSLSSSNLSAGRHISAPSTSADQAITDKRASSSVVAGTTSNTLSTSTDADIPKVATSQMVPVLPDLLGDDGVFATEQIGREQSPSTQDLGHLNNLIWDTCSTSIQTSCLNEVANNQPTTLSPASSQPPQGPTGETQLLIGVQPSLADTNAGGRKELPADLFASPYQLSSVTAAGRPAGSNYGAGFSMHYYPLQMQVLPSQNVAKSSNPFDTNDNTAQPHMFNTFASTGFPQGGSGHMFIPSGMSHTSSFESHLSGSASTGSPIYLSNVHHQSPNVPAGSSQSAYMEQSSFQNKLPTSIQGTSGFGSEVESTALLYSNQQIPYRYPDQSSFSMGAGNPFG